MVVAGEKGNKRKCNKKKRNTIQQIEITTIKERNKEGEKKNKISYVKKKKGNKRQMKKDKKKQQQKTCTTLASLSNSRQIS